VGEVSLLERYIFFKFLQGKGVYTNSVPPHIRPTFSGASITGKVTERTIQEFEYR
jgi:hypothetical protein